MNNYFNYFVLLLLFIATIKCEVLVVPTCDCNNNDQNVPPNINISLSISYNNPSTIVNTNKITSDECGLSRPKALLASEESYEGQYPWYVSIYKVTFQSISYHCSGTLISKNAVLTSAACVTVGQPIDPGNLLIFIGAYNFLKFNGNYQHRSVKEILLHPNFDYSTLESDVAILKLKSRIKITDFVRPACLYMANERLDRNVGTQGTVSTKQHIFIFP